MGKQWQVGRSMKERLGLRRQERLQFSLHRWEGNRDEEMRFYIVLPLENPEVLSNLHVNVLMILRREEKKRFETGGERTDAILLWNSPNPPDASPSSIVFMMIKIYSRVGSIVIANYEMIYTAWLGYSDVREIAYWRTCYDFNIADKSFASDLVLSRSGSAYKSWEAAITEAS